MNNKIRTVKKKVLFYHYDAPAHTVKVKIIHELQFELLLHVPYSLDLASLDFFLFPEMKKFLDGRKFSTNEKSLQQHRV